MPGFNGTGPRGMGPMTGRGLGVCTGAVPSNYGMGMGIGRGMGMGIGRGMGAYPRTRFFANSYRNRVF